MEDFMSLKKQLCFAIYETSSEFTKLYAKVLQEFGLTYTQYLVLLALWEKDALTVKELGEKLNLGTGTLTPMISRMEVNGWLSKKRSTEDERRVYICLKSKAVNEKRAITESVSREIVTCNIQMEEYEQLMEQLTSLNLKLRNRRPDH
ncbi:MarR family winged helix-turn-helix transcriptional regulator [Bacillus sp. MRMR6]|uniref:MarR family winged helix-turn-helix transcriptional regulator n=1 Tax=Bacillus sp. MRMR6 TaxID=1928617 RepID=UPI000951759B|nr:MarR family transcriptional regulator [Bacillus sp. MRMR6]OLS33704.1 MarR family transcriptional regulator [Bacillus sp. MRMR6]